MCSHNNIKVRSGAFCNPGENQYRLNLSSEEVEENFKKGNKCWDMKDIINGKPTGSIRISFGYSSIMDDVDKFVRFLQDNYVINKKEVMVFETSLKPRIISLHIYPIKGCLGFRVNNWPIDKNGLKWDRHFGIYDSRDKSIRLKSNIKLGIIQPEITIDGFITLINVDNGDSISFYVDQFDKVSDSINYWISDILGEEGCQLVECGSDKNFRNTSQYLLVNMNSLHDLNYRILSDKRYMDWVPEYVKKVLTPYVSEIEPYRFRPNIVIEGIKEYDEEKISSFECNGITFKNDMNCSICYTTTVNTKLKQMDVNLEPMRTLLKYRKTNGKVLFGTLFNVEEIGNENILKEGEITLVN
jgi:molybdenum cofactor sulfurtransferase